MLKNKIALEKHKCMIKNNVTILRKADIKNLSGVIGNGNTK